MTANGWLQIALFALVILALTKPLGLYLFRVFEAEEKPAPRLFGPLERGLFRLCGVDPRREQGWVGYAASMVLFSLLGVLVTYVILRAQHLLPLNPQHLPAVPADLAFNTAVSFATNTDWQSYAGETTVSYLTQMAGLAWHNFTSAAVGIGVALAVARGLTRQPGPEGAKTLGNFWVDLVRAILYVLLPISAAVALFLVATGVPQTLAAYREVTTLEGGKQLVALGPVASQEAIKMLGTNGGGFFNANGAHPFENPTPLSNFVEMVLIFAISAGLTWTYGRMARSQRQGWALFGAMAFLFAVGVAVLYRAESGPNPALRGLAVTQTAGNLEGKETRFGIADTALFATATTDASCGAVNAMHDSFTPLGGLVPLVNIQLGEVIFGGVGAGLYGMLVMVLLTVFIAGLMVGRTPEYLGKKVEAREMKLAMLYVLVFPLVVLTLTGWSVVTPLGTGSFANAGPHGLSEALYAFTSGAGNNGSAFAGLNANTRFWNVALGADMLVGRFLMMIPALAIAGSMVGKKAVPASLGTFPTDGWLFSALLVSVIVVVGALTFFPALSLGPVLEHFLAAGGKVL
ncbi:potassium-transporting ATPase subunit KdpA [Anaeromyxobacter paludicola]|uniref:Potassium-transporting ATPase potassium-binding subunit n=1 Tax=Anaeromyxobacter paludicola TaxID=2918171 RepID=A0ABN6N970_9BACT|nr:potassium-transporting ATPase subunit KdpA [Anaeromyxobacter paludicola]BDG08875.1 potassium-transporting ATPase potassium-binding subunit [Anaeromyxobacter paludicola]